MDSGSLAGHVLLMGWPGRARRPKPLLIGLGRASKVEEPTMHAYQKSTGRLSGRGPNPSSLRNTKQPGPGSSSSAHRSIFAWVSAAWGSLILMPASVSLANTKVSGHASAQRCDKSEPGTTSMSGNEVGTIETMPSRRGLLRLSKQSGPEEDKAANAACRGGACQLRLPTKGSACARDCADISVGG